MNPRYLNSIDELDNLVGLSPKEHKEMEVVTQTFPFRSNEYYLSLIDWKDGHDPLRRIVIPDPRELKGGGCLDPSCENVFTKLPGVQHKYSQTGLLLLSDVCGGSLSVLFPKTAFHRLRTGDDKGCFCGTGLHPVSRRDHQRSLNRWRSVHARDTTAGGDLKGATRDRACEHHTDWQ